MKFAKHPYQLAAISAHTLRFLTLLAVCLWVSEAHAVNLRRMVRRIAAVADDVPIRRVDEVVQSARTSRAGRELLEKLNPGKRFDDLSEAAALRRAFQDVVEASDGHLLKEIESLPLPQRRAAFVVARGAKQVKVVLPDLARRGRFLREGGAETLASLGRFDDLADDALKFDLALKAGKLPSPAGAGALTLNHFGTWFQTQGTRAHRFWTQYVRPHWSLWLGSTALAAVMLAPDEYLDEIGNLTKEGMKKVARLGGKLLANAIQATVEGVGEATQEVLIETTRSVRQTFFTTPAGVASVCVLGLAALLLIPPIRRRIFAILRRLFRV